MNPGDKVEVYRPGSPLHGWVGTIDHFHAGNRTVTVVFADGDIWTLDPADLQPAEQD